MRTMIDYRREIGPSAWLLVLYWQHSTPANDPDWCPVANGEKIFDSNAAKILKVSFRTAIRWRRRLEDAGLIITEPCPGGGFRIELLRFDRQDAPARQHEPQAAWPDMPTQLVQ
jgi:hypothetical protein